jgi:hypothetical protein
MKKPLIIIGLLVAILAAYWYAFGNPVKKIFGTAGTGTNSGTSANNTTTPGTSPGGNFHNTADVVQDANGFPLMVGSNNTYVSEIQTALNNRFGSDLTVDGVFGEKTRKALSAHGFTPPIYYKHYHEILGA